MRTSAAALAVLWLMVLGYSAFMSALSIRQHDAFVTHKADLGHFDQAIWNTLHGRPLVRTQQGLQLTRLTDHVEPILIPISLVFVLWDDVRALLVLQSVAVGLGALPVFWLARDELGKVSLSRRVREGGGLVLAGVYLLFPALQAANLTEFHAAPLAVTPLLLALYYARRGWYGRMWLWALVVMAVKEEMPLLMLMLALWLLVFRRRWGHGLALAAVSLVWFGVATFVVVPHFAPLKYGIEESIYFQRYGELGDSPFAVAQALATRPALVWRIATEPARLQYLWGLLASAGLVLPLLAPEILVLSLPSLLANLLSGYEAMYSGVYHYSAPVVPFVVAAAAVGLARLGALVGWLSRRPASATRDPSQQGSRPQQAAVVGVAVLLLLGTLAYHRVRGHTPLAQGFAWPAVTEHHRLLEQRFAPQIPARAVLSTTAPLFPHLDHRERIHQFPLVDDAEWVLLDAGSFPEMHPADFRVAYDELIASGVWCIVDAADGYVLLERRETAATSAGQACQRELPDAFYDFARADGLQPTYPVEADFGARIRLLGYDVTAVPQWRRVGVRLYWTWASAEQERPTGLQPYVFWSGEGGQVVGTTAERPLVEPYWYPPERWRQGEVVVTEMLPWDVGPEFRLGVAVVDAGGNRLPVQLAEKGGPSGLPQAELPVYAMEDGSWLRLQAFKWEGAPTRGKVVVVDEGATALAPVQATFGGRIALAGFDLQPDRPQAGGELRLRLRWFKIAGPLERDYTVFVHLLDGSGEGVAQGDGRPNYLSVLPTTAWRPGVPVLDEHVLSLPTNLAAGSYSLLIGWYDLQTGERLPLEAGGDSLELATVQVR